MSDDPEEPQRRPSRVLVVEDDGDIRGALCDLLSSRGFEVAWAADGREALARLGRGSRPDVILLDLMMPVMSGAEFRAAQLADPALAAIPVVVLTASDPTQATVLTLAVDAAFSKPFDTTVLFALVEQLAEEGRRRQGVPPPAPARAVPAPRFTESALGS